MSTAPRWASACGPTSRRSAAASKVRAHRAGAAVPACGHADATVRESRPLDVRPGPPDRPGGHLVEVHVQRVTARHAGGGPGARDRRQGLGRHREQPPPVRRVGRDQGMGARAGPGAVSLRAAQPPLVPVVVQLPASGRAGGRPTLPTGCPAAAAGRPVRPGSPPRPRGPRQALPGTGPLPPGPRTRPTVPGSGPTRAAADQAAPTPPPRGTPGRRTCQAVGSAPLAAGVRKCPHRCRAGRGCRRRAPPPRRGCPPSAAGWSRRCRRATG